MQIPLWGEVAIAIILFLFFLGYTLKHHVGIQEGHHYAIYGFFALVVLVFVVPAIKDTGAINKATALVFHAPSKGHHSTSRAHTPASPPTSKNGRYL